MVVADMILKHSFGRGFRPGGATLAGPQLGFFPGFVPLVTAGVKAYTDLEKIKAQEDIAKMQIDAKLLELEMIRLQQQSQGELPAEDIIPGVPNWLLLLGGAGAVVGLAVAL